jgi:DNA-binding response OmpR family regulator
MEKILIVEDDSKVQRALQRLFAPEGFQVETASDGPSALGLFRTAPASAVVLDLRLPGMSGRDVCRELRQVSATVPIIILSAVSEVMD